MNTLTKAELAELKIGDSPVKPTISAVRKEWALQPFCWNADAIRGVLTRAKIELFLPSEIERLRELETEMARLHAECESRGHERVRQAARLEYQTFGDRLAAGQEPKSLRSQAEFIKRQAEEYRSLRIALSDRGRAAMAIFSTAFHRTEGAVETLATKLEAEAREHLTTAGYVSFVPTMSILACWHWPTLAHMGENPSTLPSRMLYGILQGQL